MYFYDKQIGFRNKHSKTHALIEMTEKLENLLIKNISPVVYSLTSKKHLILKIMQHSPRKTKLLEC